MMKSPLIILVHKILNEVDEITTSQSREELINETLSQIERSLDNPVLYHAAEFAYGMITDIAFNHFQTNGIGVLDLVKLPEVKAQIINFSNRASEICMNEASSKDPKVNFIVKSSIKKAFKFIASASIEQFPGKVLYFYRYDHSECPFVVYDGIKVIDLVDDEEGEILGNILSGYTNYTVLIKSDGLVSTGEAHSDFAGQLLLNFGWWFSHSHAEFEKIRNKEIIDLNASDHPKMNHDLWDSYKHIPRNK
jgi:hypothetical protein